MIFAVGAGIGIANSEKKDEQLKEIEPVGKVFLRVAGKDETISNQIKSYLLRELREIKDVVVVDDIYEADWAFEITTHPVVINDNYVSGYALSWVLLEPKFIKKMVDGAFIKCEYFSEEFKQAFEKTVVFNTGGLRILPASDLKSIQSLITDFDIQHLEPERQSKRELNELRKEYLKGQQKKSKK